MKKIKFSKKYCAAIYLRLSREDGDVVDGGKTVSDSIANQKALALDFLKSNPDIELYDIYIDDGYSGVNFNRPDFQRMLKDVREGTVNCIIVKDLSRFARNYIESGRVIEKIFGNNMIVPFKNLMNDAYGRDISVKVRSNMNARRKNGEFVGAFAVYGYLKDEADKNHLVVDEYAAEVVRDIFVMKLYIASMQEQDRLQII